MTTDFHPHTVLARRMLTADVCEFELARPIDHGPGNPDAPRHRREDIAAAGAHVNVGTPSGDVRSYSLTGDLADPTSLRIAVRRSADGRGGSRSMVDDVRVGDLLPVSAPQNEFTLEPASGYLLVAAGIGITPILAMLHEIRRGAAGVTATGPQPEVTVLYLTRSPEESAYLAEVRELVDALPGATLVVHHRRLASAPLELWPLLADPGDRRIYCCGPEPLQETIRALTMHWRPSRVHFENFAGVSAFGELSLPFSVTWAPTGLSITVPANRTLLAALRDGGIVTPSSCESGTCGTCRLVLVAGEADHRDVVLAEDERGGYVMPCVSRALGNALVVAPVPAPVATP
ncbi:MAG: hypothetical protein JWQ43_3101 [Glaciihabitans sp.]|nr:hypothetical protein [Glaciihabitans sp.]